MKVLMFSVLDSKAGFFSQPYFGQTDAAGMRNFSDAVNDERNATWHRHPEDFSLYVIGEFDDQTGEIVGCLPRALVTASALRAVRGDPKQLDLFDKDGKLKEPVS